VVFQRGYKKIPQGKGNQILPREGGKTIPQGRGTKFPKKEGGKGEGRNPSNKPSEL